MIVFCGICADVLHENGHVVTSACGHVYHSSCISTWLSSNSTCPECRQLIKGKQLRKIYFNVRMEDSSDSEEEEEDPSETYADSLAECEQFESLRDEYKLAAELFGKRAYDAEDKLGNLKNGVRLLASIQDYTERIDEENDQLRSKVDELRDLDVLISGSKNDVRKVAKKFSQERNVSKMAKCFIVMKKELNKALDSKSDLEKKIERLTRNGSYIQQEKETRQWMIKLQQETRKTVKEVSRLLRNQDSDAPESKRMRSPDSTITEASQDSNISPDVTSCTCGRCNSGSGVSNISNAEPKPSTSYEFPSRSSHSQPPGITVDATAGSNNKRSSILIKIPPSVLKAQQGNNEIHIKLGIDGIVNDTKASVSFK